jgi:hypothetical protein
LALYITVDGGYDLFWVHNTWMYRDGLIQKIGFVVISADFALLALVGLVSTVSFFLKKQIWKPITKGIIANVALWLIMAGLMICMLVWGFIYKICGLLIIGLFAWMMLRIWKMIK